MAVPARADRATAQEPPDSADVHDPRAHGWADVQRGLIIGSEAWRLALEDLVAAAERAGGPDSEVVKAIKAAGEMVRLTGGVVDCLGQIGRRWVLDEHVLADVERRAYDAGYAAAKAERCRLASVPGPH